MFSGTTLVMTLQWDNSSKMSGWHSFFIRDFKGVGWARKKKTRQQKEDRKKLKDPALRVEECATKGKTVASEA